MGKIIRFSYTNKELLELSFSIRREVYIVEQKVDENEEFEYEEESIHYLIYHKKEAVGTARYRVTKEGVKLERFAILKKARGKGFGRDILRYLLTDVRPLNKKIYLHAQTLAINFYKQQSFIISGPKFMEANIEHYPMEYDNTVALEKALSLAVCRR